ncbi:MAG: helix-turn-helix transcriptional regulator [Chloroflexi bacterium]|nr:helix-turn-helix transcriptional regulator [Chloroflexota bacterium]
MEDERDNQPCYVISVAARMVKVHPQTLRYYERLGIVEPSRSRGNLRLYSQRDIERLRHIKRLVDDLGVNLAGVEVIMNMAEKIVQMEREMEEMRREFDAEVEQLRKALAKAEPAR